MSGSAALCGRGERLLKSPGDAGRVGGLSLGRRTTDWLAGAGLDGAMSLAFNMLLHGEFKVRVVFRVVTTAANLENDAGIAFVAQTGDGSDPARAVCNMVTARSVARFAAHAGEVRMRGRVASFWKAAGPRISGGVAAQAVRIVGLTFDVEGIHSMSVRATGPGGEFGGMTTLAGP